jgi:hypothetical protein
VGTQQIARSLFDLEESDWWTSFIAGYTGVVSEWMTFRRIKQYPRFSLLSVTRKGFHLIAYHAKDRIGGGVFMIKEADLRIHIIRVVELK